MKTCKKGLHQFDNNVRRGCGECKKTRDDANRRANPEGHSARVARYRAKHPGKAAADAAKYRASHPGKASAQAKQRRADNPEWAKKRDAEANARLLYGISAEEHRARVSRPCEICGHIEKRVKGMHVDHDHETGRLRGTLCHDCNTGIGHFDDSTPRLLSAIQYLARYA